MQHLANLLLNTDSYKASHWLQYPPGTDATFFYVQSRGGIHDRTVFFGLQAIVAVVSDSYDIFHAIRQHWGTTLKQEVIDSGATVVIRPDSGDPVAVVHQCLDLLDEAFGHTVNGKGYKVLNHVRVIQGDGINPHSIRAILERITSAGYATDNLAFGMGGALLQRLDDGFIDVADDQTGHGQSLLRGHDINDSSVESGSS